MTRTSDMATQPNYFTEAERGTLNAAEQIITKRFGANSEVLMFSFHAGWEGISVTYFSPNNVQTGGVWPAEDRTLAGKLNECLTIRADEEGRADQIRDQRIEQLRAELANLTDQVAA